MEIRTLRGICWAVALLALWQALKTPATTAPGGPKFGLILAATLIAALHWTGKKGLK